MNKLLFFFCLVSGSLLLSSCGNSSASSSSTSTLPVVNQDSILFLAKNKTKIKLLDEVFKNRVYSDGFNGCVLVAQKGRVMYKNAFGFSNLKTQDSLKINSAFQLASTSKTLTAGAILLLKDQGKLQLGDNVKKYIPSFPYDKITIEMLLTHRSGLSNYIYFSEPYCDANNCYNGKTFDNNAVLEIMQSTQPALYAGPNKKFEYCNTNYALLASIVEKVSGMGFHHFMEQNVFIPLGMSNTWVCGTKNDSSCTLKTQGHNGSGIPEKDTYADYVVGDKGIYSTVEDMFKWSQALYSGSFLKKETIEQAYTGYSKEHPGKRNYGYGWRLIEDSPEGKIVYHNGWWHGYSTLFYRRISDETTVILLSNKFNSKTYHIEDILAVLDNKPLPVAEVKKEAEAKYKTKKTAVATSKTKKNSKSAKNNTSSKKKPPTQAVASVTSKKGRG
ncbi:MAG: serine hydrolase domain-containing protein [Bacteroidia bacterium]|jgi:CubicO group peptidase (beta-lactamase class C family)